VKDHSDRGAVRTGRRVTPSLQNFFPKNLAKKLGRVLQPEISGMVCVRVLVLVHPAPLSCR